MPFVKKGELGTDVKHVWILLPHELFARLYTDNSSEFDRTGRGRNGGLRKGGVGFSTKVVLFVFLFARATFQLRSLES